MSGEDLVEWIAWAALAGSWRRHPPETVSEWEWSEADWAIRSFMRWIPFDMMQRLRAAHVAKMPAEVAS